eukprot:8142777-Pyramimonas_sp.AAC.1
MKYNRVASRSYCTLARRDARALEASSVHAEMPGERKERKKKVANVADPQEPEARIWRWLRGPCCGDIKDEAGSPIFVPLIARRAFCCVQEI